MNLPREGTTVCAAYHKPRGNTRRGWVPILHGAEVVGFTCPDCPAVEPIRRVQSSTGMRFRAVVDATPRGAVQRRQVTRTLPTLEAARAFVAEVRAEVVRTGAFATPDAETVAALCERWLTSRRDVRQVTRQGYPEPARAGTAPDRVPRRARDQPAREALAAWLSREGGRRGQPLGPRAVRVALGTLAQALDLAVREGTISRNVARLARRPRHRKRVGRDLEHWQPAELLTFRDAADRDPLAGPGGSHCAG